MNVSSHLLKLFQNATLPLTWADDSSWPIKFRLKGDAPGQHRVLSLPSELEAWAREQVSGLSRVPFPRSVLGAQEEGYRALADAVANHVVANSASLPGTELRYYPPA